MNLTLILIILLVIPIVFAAFIWKKYKKQDGIDSDLYNQLNIGEIDNNFDEIDFF